MSATTHRHDVHCLPLSVCTSLYVSSSHTAMPYTVCPCRSVRLCLFLTHRHAVHCLPLSVCTSMSLPHTPPCRTLSAPVGLYVYVSSSHTAMPYTVCPCRSVRLCLFLTHRHAVHCLPLSVCTSMSLPHTPPCRTLSAPVGLYVYVSSSHATISCSFCLCRSVCLSNSFSLSDTSPFCILPLSVCTSVCLLLILTHRHFVFCLCRSVRLSASLSFCHIAILYSVSVGLYVCLSPSLFLTHRHFVFCICLSVCLSASLPLSDTSPFCILYLSVCMSVSLSLTHRHFVFCICRSVCLSVSLSLSDTSPFCILYLSVCMSVCLPLSF